MAEVKLEIASRSYVVTCQDGEEDHLRALGEMVNEKAKDAGAAAGLNESRMLLFTSLLLADDLAESKKLVAASPNEPATSTPEHKTDERALLALERLADRIEEFASHLENRV